MVIKDKNAGIFKMKIEIGEHFAANKEDLWIELREPNTEEAMQLSKSAQQDSDKIDQSKVFEIIPHCIIDHNFESAENKKMGVPDVWKMIKDRTVCAIEVAEQWGNNIPLAKKRAETLQE